MSVNREHRREFQL